jgi:ligand-binding sensor domain-containing protein
MRNVLCDRSTSVMKAVGPICFVALTVLLTTTQVAAQRYFFENVSVQHGLPASKVYAALQDEFGLVWIGTEAGLASYDGNRITNHGTQDGMAPNGARSLLMDKDGRLWTGHLDGGITIHDGNTFTAYTLGEDMHSAITAMVQADDGSIWIATAGHGAFRTNGPQGSGTVLPADRFDEEKGLQTVLLTVMKLKDGRICFVEDRGTLRSIAQRRRPR